MTQKIFELVLVVRNGLIVVFVFLTLMPWLAYAYCSEPMAPSAPSSFGVPTKPTPPFCVNTITKTHTCSDWELQYYNSAIAMYNNEVDDYIRKLKNYVREASDFANEALAYAKCRINNLN